MSGAFCDYFKIGVFVFSIEDASHLIGLCERLNVNPFTCIFVHFTIVTLTWDDFA